MNRILTSVDAGFEFGMFQHRQEVVQFLTWLDTVVGRMERVIEIGGHRGGTAAMFCSFIEGTVLSIDKPDGEWGGIGYDQAAKRNELLHEKYCPKFIGLLADSHSPRTSDDVHRVFSYESVDLLFIDGDHSYIGVQQDYGQYERFVRSGGVIAFHDINDTALHHERGVQVPKFWKTLKGNRTEFSIDADWGGIGAIIK
jgi:predicted O-methyltransferase YrrM